MRRKKRRYLARGVALVYREIDKMMEHAVAKQEEKGQPVSCRRGCSACCGQVVCISLPEAVAIVDWCFRHGKRKWLESRLPQMREQAAYLLSPTATRSEWFRERRERCALLERVPIEPRRVPRQMETLCGVYPVRPFFCRTYYAVTPAEHCAPEYTEPMATLDTRVFFDAYAERMEQDACDVGFHAYYAPLPLIVDWAYTFCTKGPLACKKEIERAGFSDPRTLAEFFYQLVERGGEAEKVPADYDGGAP